MAASGSWSGKTYGLQSGFITGLHDYEYFDKINENI